MICLRSLSTSTPRLAGLGMLPLGIPLPLGPLIQPPSAMTLSGPVPSSTTASEEPRAWNTSQTDHAAGHDKDEQDRLQQLARELEVEKAERLRLEEERRQQEEERQRLAEERRQLEELRWRQEQERQRLEDERRQAQAQAQETMRKKKEEEAARQLQERQEWERQEEMKNEKKRAAAAAEDEKRLMDALKAKQVCG